MVKVSSVEVGVLKGARDYKIGFRITLRLHINGRCILVQLETVLYEATTYGNGNSLAVGREGGTGRACFQMHCLKRWKNRTKFLFTRASVAVVIRFMFLSKQNIADIAYHLS